MNVVLIGYRSSGKTSVGIKLAEKLSFPFYDTDWLIEKETRVTVCELVAKEGWDYFRKKEKEVLGKLAILKNCVIATGGGIVMDKDNAAMLRKMGVLAWLEADLKAIKERLLKDPATATLRPSLSGVDIIRETEELLKKRNPIYKDLANLVVNTSDKNIDQVTEELYRLMQKTKETPLKEVSYGR